MLKRAGKHDPVEVAAISFQAPSNSLEGRRFARNLVTAK